MNVGMLVGPATWVFLAGQLVVAIWWASSIDGDVHTLKQSTVTAERIGKLDTHFRDFLFKVSLGRHVVLLAVDNLSANVVSRALMKC